MIQVNEYDFLKIQNEKSKEYDANRINHKDKEVRLEKRVEILESSVKEIESDFRMMNKTLSSIDETLKQLKDEMKQLHQFDISLIRMKDRMDNQDKLVKKLFEKSDLVEEKLGKINIKEAGNDVKLGFNERVVWLIVAGAIGAMGWFKNG